MTPCFACGQPFEPKADGQRACSFPCAAVGVRGERQDTLAPSPRRHRVAEALRLTRSNVARMRRQEAVADLVSAEPAGPGSGPNLSDCNLQPADEKTTAWTDDDRAERAEQRRRDYADAYESRIKIP